MYALGAAYGAFDPTSVVPRQGGPAVCLTAQFRKRDTVVRAVGLLRAMAALARAYVPPVGWVERHGGTGASRRSGLGRAS